MAAARRRGTMKILLRIETKERTTTKTGLLCSKWQLDIFHRIQGMISYLDCVQPSTLRVRQSGHVKKESPWKVLKADEEKKTVTCHRNQECQERKEDIGGWRTFWAPQSAWRWGKTINRYSYRRRGSTCFLLLEGLSPKWLLTYKSTAATSSLCQSEVRGEALWYQHSRHCQLGNLLCGKIL